MYGLKKTPKHKKAMDEEMMEKLPKKAKKPVKKGKKSKKG